MDADVVDEAQLLVIWGLVCCNVAFYPVFPDCVGCSSKGECLCLALKCCLKCGVAPLACDALSEQVCCQLGCCCCAIGLKCPTVICKRQTQVLCVVENAALPPDEEIPAVIAVCCLECYPECGCCKRLRMTLPAIEKQAGGPASPDAICEQPIA
mmetsp:Transcript_30147/g.93251  ORF Transcript_30147/g.93251 Transcript_30147/m.93251 type:complete len:154 (+) Transcript_30147:1365-1826(+)